jgi:hypothetical protein
MQRLSLLLIAIVASGCPRQTTPVGDNGDPTADAGTPSTPDGGAEFSDLFAEGRKHLVVGSTFYFPSGRSFELNGAPAGNQNQPFVDQSSGRTAFVAHLAGRYTFQPRQPGASPTVLEVVEPETIQFYNSNYYPVRPMAEKGSSLWVAAVISPFVVEFEKEGLVAKGRIGVGGWPVSVAFDKTRNQLVVACRAEDALVLVDLASRRTTRSVWVGDEVADVVVSGDLAVATLPTDGEVVFVDLTTNTIRTRTKVGQDATYLAFGADGKRVYVAGRRTGKAQSCGSCGPDISELDVSSGAVIRSIAEVGTTLGGLALSPDGKRLYVVGLRNNNEDGKGSLSQPLTKPFQHSVIEFDLSTDSISETRVVDLTGDPFPNANPGGVSRTLVSLHSPVVASDALWLAAESVDTVVQLKLPELSEVRRAPVPGRPRAVMLDEQGRLFAFGHQAQLVSSVAAAVSSGSLGADPRPADVVEGQRFFTGAGAFTPVGPPMSMLGIAGNAWSCNSCHVDGLSDRLEWQAGPVRTHRNPSRPFTILEGAWPLGWQGYLSSIRNYAYTVTGNVGIPLPTNAQVDPLNAYLVSLMPPPAATSLTERNGGLSVEALQGREVFDRDCAGCHPAPLFTSRARIEQSVEDGKRADVPSLLGAYRNGTFYRSGGPKTLEAAVRDMVVWSKVVETEAETKALVRYVSELTGRDFYLLATHPHSGEAVGGNLPIELVFSQPVDPSIANLAKVTLVDSAGASLAAATTVTGTRVVLTSVEPLPRGSTVSVRIDPGFRSLFDTELTTSSMLPQWKTPAPSTLKFEGVYELKVTQPRLGPPMPGPLPTTVVTVTASQGIGLVPIRVTYQASTIRWDGFASVSGTSLKIPPLPILTAGGFADGFSGFSGELVDSDGDGIADTVAAGPNGTRNYTISGPGFELPEMEWELKRVVGR